MAFNQILEKIARAKDLDGDHPLINDMSLLTAKEAWENLLENGSRIEKVSAEMVLALFEEKPELAEPIKDYSFIKTHADDIKLILSIFMPSALTTNQIMVAGLPMVDFLFNPTERYAKILENGGPDVSLEFRNWNYGLDYIYSCVFALAAAEGIPLNFSRPLYIDIKDGKGMLRNYKVLMNADHGRIIRTENSPNLSEKDILELMDNFEDVELWKSKIPPNSYRFEGIIICYYVDVTADDSISQLKDLLLKKNGFYEDNTAEQMQSAFRSVFGIADLQIGISNYKEEEGTVNRIPNSKWASLILDENDGELANDLFCSNANRCIMHNKEPFFRRDVAAHSHHSYRTLENKGILSYIGIPLLKDNQIVGLLELGSPRKNELNSIIANKLNDILPSFNLAVERTLNEFETEIDSIIQEQCTAIHPSVKWKFAEEAEKVFQSRHLENEDIEIADIAFEEVMPLFGQIDIKGSSTARNDAIQADLLNQLELANEIFSAAQIDGKVSAYGEIQFRIQRNIEQLKSGLSAGQEASILEFMRSDVNSVFDHIQRVSPKAKTLITEYREALHPVLNMIYDKRKDYEESVTKINKQVSKMLDKAQLKAQKDFPHYFEKYKTDGVEFNCYIGQSISRNQQYHEIHLKNLRIWQLETMLKIERKLNEKRPSLPTPLDVASLILVHGSPMAIQFRKDEKKFDVDGAYNVRYEILKKRIDKAHIKNTDERITQPGKLAIIYTAEADAKEYLKFLDYMAAQGLVEREVERLQLEDVQGASGLKALRATLIYPVTEEDLSDKTMDDILTNDSKQAK